MGGGVRGVIPSMWPNGNSYQLLGSPSLRDTEFCCALYSFDEFGIDIIDSYEFCTDIGPQYRVKRAYMNSDLENVSRGVRHSGSR